MKPVRSSVSRIFDLKKAREAHFESVRRAYEAGVTIAIGTDFVGMEMEPHGDNAEKIVLYVEEIGVKPWKK